MLTIALSQLGKEYLELGTRKRSSHCYLIEGETNDRVLSTRQCIIFAPQNQLEAPSKYETFPLTFCEQVTENQNPHPVRRGTSYHRYHSKLISLDDQNTATQHRYRLTSKGDCIINARQSVSVGDFLRAAPPRAPPTPTRRTRLYINPTTKGVSRLPSCT